MLPVLRAVVSDLLCVENLEYTDSYAVKALEY